MEVRKILESIKKKTNTVATLFSEVLTNLLSTHKYMMQYMTNVYCIPRFQ